MLLPDDRRPHELLLRPTRFCAYSLGDWIRLCEKTGTPHVPAYHVIDFERYDILQHDEAGPHQGRLDAAYEHVRRAAQPGWMLRWDCCASSDLKMAMAESETPDRDTLAALPIDARVQEILLDFPRVVVPVWRRPWIRKEMRHVDGYPVEYRAFVKNGRLRGISSYYPQRRLPRRNDDIDAVERHVATLVDHLEGPFEWSTTHDEGMQIPRMTDAILERKTRASDAPEPDGIHFTADFAATSHGMVLLEGGPPHFLGAHPCCFRPGKIDGVALEDRNLPDDTRDD